jgi:hypothetical protein
MENNSPSKKKTQESSKRPSFMDNFLYGKREKKSSSTSLEISSLLPTINNFPQKNSRGSGKMQIEFENERNSNTYLKV